MHESLQILGRVSTYVLMGLAFGFYAAGILVAIPLRPKRPALETWATGSVVVFLYLLGTVAFTRIPMRAARRFASEVIELRGLASSR